MNSMEKRRVAVTEGVKEFEASSKTVGDYIELFIVAKRSLSQGIALSWPELEEAIKKGIT